jgi:hypothetical protein
MTEVSHLRCDRCDRDVITDLFDKDRERGWAHCRIELMHFDFCPSCWKAILELANVEKPK